MKKLTAFILNPIILLYLPVLVTAGTYWHQNLSDRPLAFVQKFKPTVAIANADSYEDVTERGQPLFNGDTLQTEEQGFALVQFMDKSMSKIKPDSRLIVQGEVQDKQNSNTRVNLDRGEIFLQVADQSADKFEVETPTSVASVKGTEFGATAEGYFWVQEGEVEIEAFETGQTRNLTAREYGKVSEDGDIEKGLLSDEELEELGKDYDQMDENLEPEIYKLRFLDEDGQEQTIDVKVFEN